MTKTPRDEMTAIASGVIVSVDGAVETTPTTP